MIFHITSEQDWVKAVGSGEYRPASLEKDGVIRCSTFDQLMHTANRNFRGQEKLVILCIREEHLESPLKYGDLGGGNPDYPHIHGPLNLDAVVNVVDLAPETDGSFELPEEFALFNN